MTKAFAALVGLSLFACWSARSSRVGDGLWSVECKRSRGNCYEEAAERCPDGFDVVDGANHSGVYAAPMGNAVMAMPVFRGEMIVQCRQAVGR